MPTKAQTSKAISPDQLLHLYREMLLVRRTEELLAKTYAAGLIPGACHTYIGQEAVAVGVCAHLRKEDVIFSTHRGHGHALAKGVPPRQVVAELLGKATGCSRGRGGSMHLFSPEVGLMGTSGIVGPSILQAAGAGQSFALLGRDNVSVAFFGDGAVSNGAFHEGINLATIYQLPVLFVCENNLYATEVSFDYASRNPAVANRGTAYGINSALVDGNDVQAVYAAAAEAVDRARAGEGPTLLECRTYRTRPHAEGMRDASYRTQDEIERWKTRDPINTLGDRLVAEGHAAAEALQAIDAEMRAVADEALVFAKNSPWPDPATATDFVFSQVGA